LEETEKKNGKGGLALEGAGMIDVMLKSAPIVPYIPATDVARARKFYEEKVGLVPKEEVAGGVVYECGKRSWIFLYQSAGAGTSKCRA